jgi:hypothetical protein
MGRNKGRRQLAIPPRRLIISVKKQIDGLIRALGKKSINYLVN